MNYTTGSKKQRYGAEINNEDNLLMALFLTIITLFLIIICGSFRNSDIISNDRAGNSFNSSSHKTKGLVCAAGTPKGKPVQTNIGSEGGTISSADGRVIITIPEGALADEITIEVTPVSNTNPAGNGLAYRITPHGIQFQKPVSISFSYAGENGQKKIPQLQGIAYQDDSGIWKSVKNGTIDTIAKRVTVYTTHFSDWSEFETMKLIPENTIVPTGQSAVIKAVQYINDDDLLEPLGPQGGLEAHIGSPHDLPLSKIDTWELAGVGTLRSSGQKATYKAPAMVKGGRATAAVTVKLNTKRGLVLLIANIVVVNEGITFRIDGGQWIHFKKNECGYDDMPNRIYAEDSSGSGASAMIDWPEKGGHRMPWTTTAQGLSPSFVFHTDHNFTNYYSIRTVGEAAEEEASAGYVEFHHFPVSKDDYVSGYFFIEKGDKYNVRGEKLAEVKIEGYFYVRTKQQTRF